MSLTPYQTVGPYLALGLRVGVQSPDAPADPQAITITGRLIDGAGEGITDGMTVDAEGHLWSTRWDGYALVHHAPDGRVLEKRSPKVAGTPAG